MSAPSWAIPLMDRARQVLGIYGVSDDELWAWMQATRNLPNKWAVYEELKRLDGEHNGPVSAD